MTETAATTGDEAQEGDTPQATKAAQDHANANNVDLTQVQGTGKDGQITKPDVQAHIDSNASEQEDQTQGTSAGEPPTATSPQTGEILEEPSGQIDTSTFSGKVQAFETRLGLKGYVRIGDLTYSNGAIQVRLQPNQEDEDDVDVATTRDGDEYKALMEHCSPEYLEGQIP